MAGLIDYSEMKENIPSNVLSQMELLLKDSGVEKNPEILSRMIEAWLLKRAFFNKTIEHKNFNKIKTFNKNNQNGCVAITLSGSILTVGPLIKHNREIIYSSISLRTDVPREIKVENGILTTDIVIDNPLVFTEGPIKQTSPVIDLAIAPDSVKLEEQNELIRQISQILQYKFIATNKESLSIHNYDHELSGRNDLFKQWIILQWFMIGGLDQKIFLVRAKLLWLELFTKLYDELKNNQVPDSQFDQLFLKFTNQEFADYIDDYKWYESEKKNFDIGLMKALEEIPQYQHYWDYLNNYLLF